MITLISTELEVHSKTYKNTKHVHNFSSFECFEAERKKLAINSSIHIDMQ